MSLNRITALACAVALSIGSLAMADEGKKEEHIKPEQVPAKVMDAFKKDFPGAKIEEVEKETYADGTVHYEFGFKDAAGKEHEVEYNADGEQLDEHEDESADHKHDEKKEDKHDHKH
jgi:hypothetical protein